jgi:putative membrane protein
MKLPSRLLAAAALVMLLVPVAVVRAQQPPGEARAFFEEAARANITGIRMGELARERAAAQGVKDFAAQMIIDHTRALEQLGRTAQRSGVRLPDAPAGEQAAVLARLRGLRGDAFDKAFLDEQVAAHGRLVRLLEAQSADPADPNAGQYATATLPGVQAHEGVVRSLSHAGGRNLRGADAPPADPARRGDTGNAMPGTPRGTTIVPDNRGPTPLPAVPPP